MIKRIGTAAREELERFFATRVYLDLHVKVRSEWREDERVLDEIGLGKVSGVVQAFGPAKCGTIRPRH